MRRRHARLLTLQDVSRLTPAWGDPVRPIFLVGVLTGLRIGELLALYVEDVDLSDAMLHVRRDVYRGRVGTTKAPRSARHVPLASALIHAVRKWLEIRPKGSDWLFPSKAGTPYRDRNLPRRNVWPVCDGLGVRRFGWHSLRHTFSTYNGNNRVPVPVLQALLGHSSAETIMIYTHPLEDAPICNGRLGRATNESQQRVRISSLGDHHPAHIDPREIGRADAGLLRKQ